uniref:NADH-ubiquinone oxidoreductase chain 6 n=1 Tax=Idaea salutaria TaxID=2992014 RepID=A0A9E8ACM6_9NEOP|nr:NADH dehydrogenase subunit 6 [Idaea salutaria]UYX62338.1 NADH dehydrogenase subunit 6 [Idaea salutaria]
MLKMFLSLLMLLLSFFLLFINNPISMGFLILIQTLLLCMLSGILIKTYWFSYILFLTFMGGLLVLFIYVASIASNELFNFSMNNKIYFMIMMLIIIFSQIYLFKNLKWMNLSNNISDNENYNYIMFFNNEHKMNLNKLYNSHNFLMMMMMVIYLFITLIAVVKITNILYGPLRSI